MSGRPFLAEGGHGSVLLLGWWNWEGGWAKGGRRGIERYLALARRGQCSVLELDGFTLEHMRDRGDEDLLRRLADAGREGSLEPVGGTYSQAYLATLWEESNLRQFLLGLDSHRKSGIPVRTFAYQEPAFHPQLPGILASFGYEQAVLRSHWPLAGRERSFRSPVILWKGLDGTTIPAITDPPALGSSSGVLASKLGDLMLFGRVPVGSRLFMRPRLAPALRFQRTTFARYLESARNRRTGPLDARTLDATDSTFRLPWGAQAGVAWLNLREAEARLLEAEKIASLSWVLGGGRFERALEAAWKALLASEAHDFFMCPSLFCPATGERTYRTAIRLTRISKGIAETVARLGAETIAGALSASKAPVSSDDSTRLVGFNALNWERTGWVHGEIRFPRGRISMPRVMDGASVCPTSLDEEKRWEDGSLAWARFRFLTRLPSLGARVFRVGETTDEATPSEPPASSPLRGAEVGIRLSEGRLVLEGRGRDLPLAIKLGRRPVPIEGLESFGDECGRVRLGARADHKAFHANFAITIEGSRVSLSMGLRFPHRSGVGPRVRAFDDLGKLRLAIPWRGGARRNLPFAFYPSPRRGSFLANDMVYGDDCAFFTAGSPGFHLESGVLTYPLATSGLFLYGVLALSGSYAARIAIDLDPPEDDAEAMRQVMEWRHPLRAISLPAGAGPPQPRHGRRSPLRSASLLPDCRDLAATAVFPREGKLHLHVFALGSREARWEIPAGGLVRAGEPVLRVPPHGIRRIVVHPAAGGSVESIDFTTPIDLDGERGPFTVPLPPYLPWRPTLWLDGEPREANSVVALADWTRSGLLRVTSECHVPPPATDPGGPPAELFLEYTGAAVTSLFDDIPTPVVGRTDERIEARARRMRVKRGWLVSGVPVPRG